MANNAFPVAVKIEPVYLVDGALYSRVTNAEGQQNPAAIRGEETLANGDKKIRWLKPFELPAAPEESAS